MTEQTTACTHPARAWVDYSDTGIDRVQRCSDCGAWRSSGQSWDDVPAPARAQLPATPSDPSPVHDLRIFVRPHLEALKDSSRALEVCDQVCNLVDELVIGKQEIERVRSAARRLANYWRVQCDGEVAVSEMFRAGWAKIRKQLERERDDALERVRELELRIGDMRG